MLRRVIIWLENHGLHAKWEHIKTYFDKSLTNKGKKWRWTTGYLVGIDYLQKPKIKSFWVSHAVVREWNLTRLYLFSNAARCIRSKKCTLRFGQRLLAMIMEVARKRSRKMMMIRRTTSLVAWVELVSFFVILPPLEVIMEVSFHCISSSPSNGYIDFNIVWARAFSRWTNTICGWDHLRLSVRTYVQSRINRVQQRPHRPFFNLLLLRG